jgi:thioredoxin 1
MFKKKRTKATQVARLDEIQAMAAEGKPILIDFWQASCNPCRIMSGVVDEIADEYQGRAHVVKVDVTRVHDAVQAFGVRSTPTFVLLAKSQKKPSKKARKRAQGGPARAGAMTPRWRATGLIRKDQLAAILDSNGAAPDEGER